MFQLVKQKSNAWSILRKRLKLCGYRKFRRFQYDLNVTDRQVRWSSAARQRGQMSILT